MNRSRLLSSLAGLAVVASSAALLTLTGPAVAVPGQPGTPSAPTSLFHEDFENGVDATPSLLADYTGAGGFTYTADPYYLNDALCNGVIFAGSADDPAATGCSPNGTYYAFAQAFADTLGGTSNHALVNFTTGGTSAAGMVALATQNAEPIAGQGKFLTFSIDVAEAYCNQPAGRSRLSFFLLEGATAHPA